MTNAVHPRIKLFQFPRMFGIPNVSPFCCKLETWLRIARSLRCRRHARSA